MLYPPEAWGNPEIGGRFWGSKDPRRASAVGIGAFTEEDEEAVESGGGAEAGVGAELDDEELWKSLWTSRTFLALGFSTSVAAGTGVEVAEAEAGVGAAAGAEGEGAAAGGVDVDDLTMEAAEGLVACRAGAPGRAVAATLPKALTLAPLARWAPVAGDLAGEELKTAAESSIDPKLMPFEEDPFLFTDPAADAEPVAVGA